MPRAAPGLRLNITPLHRFPRSARLTRRADFDRVFAEGRRVHTRHFTLIVAETSPVPRLGLAIGRRSAARAVARNRLKRLAREAFRHASMPPFDVIVMARADAVRADRKVLGAELKRGFETLKEQCKN